MPPGSCVFFVGTLWHGAAPTRPTKPARRLRPRTASHDGGRRRRSSSPPPVTPSEWCPRTSAGCSATASVHPSSEWSRACTPSACSTPRPECTSADDSRSAPWFPDSGDRLPMTGDTTSSRADVAFMHRGHTMTSGATAAPYQRLTSLRGSDNFVALSLRRTSGDGPFRRPGSRRISDHLPPTSPICRRRARTPGRTAGGQSTFGSKLLKKPGNSRAAAVLLIPVPIAALVLAFVVAQARTTTFQAPGPTGIRIQGGVYTVQLGDSLATASSGFTARLTGGQAAQLVAMPGVVSVTRLPGPATVVPTLPGCHSATAPAAPAPVPSPSPLPAPIPPADGGVTSPEGDHAVRSPSEPSHRGRHGRMVRNEQGNVAKAPARSPVEAKHWHGRVGE